MREAAEFAALFAPFSLAGKRLCNRITHASMTLLATPAGRVTEHLIQYHVNRAAGGAAMTVTEPLGMMRHQAGLPRVQVRRRDDADGLRRRRSRPEREMSPDLGFAQRRAFVRRRSCHTSLLQPPSPDTAVPVLAHFGTAADRQPAVTAAGWAQCRDAPASATLTSKDKKRSNRGLLR
jgi:NADH:flavin oxidoreductase / NADH oxidase family